MTTEELLLARIIQLAEIICNKYSQHLPIEDSPLHNLYDICLKKINELIVKKHILAYELSENQIINLITQCSSKTKSESLLINYKTQRFDDKCLMSINLNKLNSLQLMSYIKTDNKKYLQCINELHIHKQHNKKDAILCIKKVIQDLIRLFDIPSIRLDLLEAILSSFLRLNFKKALKTASDMLEIKNPSTNYTQKIIAEAINVTPASYSEYMTAKSLPELENLVKLTKYIEKELCQENSISYDFLLGNISEPTHNLEYIVNDIGLSNESINILNFIKEYSTESYKEIINTINILISSLYIYAPAYKNKSDYIESGKEEIILKDIEEKAKAIISDTSIKLQLSNNNIPFKTNENIKIYYDKSYKLIRAGNIIIKIYDNYTTYKINDIKITKKGNQKIIEKGKITNYCTDGSDEIYCTFGNKEMDILSAISNYLNYKNHTNYLLDSDTYKDFELEISTATNKEGVVEVIDTLLESIKNSTDIPLVNIQDMKLLEIQRRLEKYKNFLDASIR